MKIPFVDLKANYQSIKEEIDSAMQAVMADTAFISGKYAKQFERDFAGYSGMKHVVACANGTDSLEILYRAIGIGPGDEVIVPAMTWISTAEAVSSLGATPVFVDVNEYFLMDVNKIEEKITAQTKAIVPVHFYGQPADMEAIMAIAEKHNLVVIEDGAQAIGAEHKGVRAGASGDYGTFSFFPSKNLGFRRQIAHCLH